jgi:hypothetical protein
MLAVGVAVAAITPPASADEPAPKPPELTITGAGFEQPETDASLACPPFCPDQEARPQWITMRWNDVRSDELGYRIWLIKPDGTMSTIHQVGPLNTPPDRPPAVATFKATHLAGGVAHCFRVSVWNSADDQAVSSSVCAAAAAPSAPSDTRAVWSDADSADVDFNRSAEYEANYRVYARRSNETQWTVRSAYPNGTAPAGKKMYRVDGLQPDTIYCFRVSGTHALGESAKSNEACVRTATSRTVGWDRDDADFTLHYPWNLEPEDRYRYEGVYDTHTTWIYSTDESIGPNNPTKPRSEMRWGTYFTGQHMWDADVFIPPGADDTCIMQILRDLRPEGAPATDLMIRMFNADGGTLRRHSDNALIAKDLYNRWFNLKVAHYVNEGTVRIYLDDRLVLTGPDNGPTGGRTFKNGVYHAGTTERAEARFRHIKLWERY